MTTIGIPVIWYLYLQETHRWEQLPRILGSTEVPDDTRSVEYQLSYRTTGLSLERCIRLFHCFSISPILLPPTSLNSYLLAF